MARKGAKLKDALHRYQGKDYRVEKQQKLRKLADKRKKARADLDDENEDVEDEDEVDEGEVGGVPLNRSVEDIGDDNGDTDEWESEEESKAEEESEEEPAGFDVSRINEIDSDSESDSLVDEIRDSNPAIAKLPSLQSLPATAASNRTTAKPNAALAATNSEGVPLSDLSDISDTEDIIPYQRLTINNTAALQRALSSFALPLQTLAFSEHQSITTSEPVQIADVEDELNRELSIYSQALSSVREARSLLRKEGTPFSRPTDYFAEMVKSDEHMGKIKAKLTDEAASKKASQDAKRQRELKKFGKQVQVEKLKERAKQKREMLDKVKLLKRKRQSAGFEDTNEHDMFDVALEDAAISERKDREDRRATARARGQQSEKSAKRQKRDQRFGFGGKKKFQKSGDAFSSADMRDYSTKRMKSGGPPSKAGSKRLGKSRRAKMK